MRLGAPILLALRQISFRTSSSALVVQATMWKASASRSPRLVRLVGPVPRVVTLLVPNHLVPHRRWWGAVVETPARGR
jgi:hypothetical protein